MDNEPKSLREAREAMGLVPMEEVIRDIPPRVEVEEQEPELPIRETSQDIVLPKGTGIVFLVSLVLSPLIYGWFSPSPEPAGYITWTAICAMGFSSLAMVFGLCVSMFKKFGQYLLNEHDPLPPTAGQLLGNPKLVKGVIGASSGMGFFLLQELAIKALRKDTILFILCVVAYLALVFLLMHWVDRYARRKYSRNT